MAASEESKVSAKKPANMPRSRFGMRVRDDERGEVVEDAHFKREPAVVFAQTAEDGQGVGGDVDFGQGHALAAPDAASPAREVLVLIPAQAARGDHLELLGGEPHGAAGLLGERRASLAV